MGATATDNYDGDLTASIVIDASAVNTAVVGSYVVTYDVTDSEGNAATQVTRTVNVVDTTAPVLSGVPGAITVECDGVPPPADVTATDACDPDVPVTLDENTTPGSCPQNYILTRTWTAVDDCGNQVNPMIVEGQVHGGLTQGIGQALWENAVYDANGQLVTGTLLDYAVPRAHRLPAFELGRTVTPCPHNPLGVKGVGEAGGRVQVGIAVDAAVASVVSVAGAVLVGVGVRLGVGVGVGV